MAVCYIKYAIKEGPMSKRGWFAVATATFGALVILAVGAEAEARGGGGGMRGGGGFHGGHHGGHHGRPGLLTTQRGFGHHRGYGRGHGFGHHRFGSRGRFGHRGVHGYGYGYGMPWGGGYGYGGPGGFEGGGHRAPTPSGIGIPPSPVLPPAIYVIGPKAGGSARRSGLVRPGPVESGRGIRRQGAGSIISVGSGGYGGSSASVSDRRHRMN